MEDLKVEREAFGRKMVFEAYSLRTELTIYITLPDVLVYGILGCVPKYFKIIDIPVNCVYDSPNKLSNEVFIKYVDKFLNKITPLNLKRLLSEETEICDLFYYTNCFNICDILEDKTFDDLTERDLPDYVIKRNWHYEVKDNISIPYDSLELSEYIYRPIKRERGKASYFGR